VELEGDRPVLLGEVRRLKAIAVAGYQAASLVTPKPVKVSLPGPATFVRLADDRRHGAPERALEEVAAAMAEEVQELGGAGCRFFQLDEPLLSGLPGETEACAAVLAAAPAGSVTLVFVPPGFRGLADLPGTHVGLDVADPAALETLAALPPGRGVFLGLFDAKHASLEDAEEVASRLAPWRAHLEGRDVLVGPNGGLAALPRDLAFEKLLQARYLAELLRRRWTLSESRR
jgi:5-methyltetrahydropteroyltriglutamate--homocysteine methyltransferase